MKVGGLKDPSIYSTILGLTSYTPPSFTPPFEPSDWGSDHNLPKRLFEVLLQALFRGFCEGSGLVKRGVTWRSMVLITYLVTVVITQLYLG